MAFQPFQLPDVPPALQAMGQLGNSLQQAAQRSLERDRMAADNLLRRRELDQQAARDAATEKGRQQTEFQNAYLKAQQLAAAGDIQGAHALMAPFGAQIQQRQAAGPSEWSAGLNNDEVNFANSLGDLMPTGQQSPAQTGIEPPARGPDGAEPQAPVHPLIAAAQKQKAADMRAVQFLTGQFNGQNYTLDPEAMRSAQLERADKAFAEAGSADGESGDIVREMYPQMRAASIAGNKPLDAEEAMKTIQGEAKLRRQTSADEARDAMAQQRLSQQETLTDRRLQQSDINNQRMVAAIMGAAQARTANQTPLEDKEAAPVNQEISNSIKDFTAKGGLREQLVHSQGALEMLKKNADNPTAWTNAIDAMIRTNTGRAAIKAQYDLYLSHSAGKTDSLDQMIAALKSSKPSPQQQKNLVGAMEASNAELRAQAKDVYDTFRDYENDPAVQSNPVVKRHFVRMEKNTFGRVPGYGQPEGPAQPQAKTAPMNPLVAAAKVSALPAQYQQAYRMAQQLLQKNPNDPKAQEAMRRIQAQMGGQ